MKEKTSPLASSCLLWGWLAGSNLTVVQMSVMLGCMALIHGWGVGVCGGWGGVRTDLRRAGEVNSTQELIFHQIRQLHVKFKTSHVIHCTE